jgi:hypothetical protein
MTQPKVIKQRLSLSDAYVRFGTWLQAARTGRYGPAASRRRPMVAGTGALNWISHS